MESALQTMKRRVASACPDALVVSAVFDKPASIDGPDTIGAPHGRKAMGDDKDRPSLGDLLHMLLDDTLAFVIERARRSSKMEYVGM